MLLLDSMEEKLAREMKFKPTICIDVKTNLPDHHPWQSILDHQKGNAPSSSWKRQLWDTAGLGTGPNQRKIVFCNKYNTFIRIVHFQPFWAISPPNLKRKVRIPYFMSVTHNSTLTDHHETDGALTWPSSLQQCSVLRGWYLKLLKASSYTERKDVPHL